MDGKIINIILDKSGSMQELGKLTLAYQIIEDLKDLFEVNLIDNLNCQENSNTLWITDGYEKKINEDVIILLIGCDRTSYKNGRENIYTMEEFPLMIERLQLL